jgi:phosphate transport system protein
MRTKFQQSLDQLKAKLLTMAGLAENAVDQAVRAYSERVPEICQRVFKNETMINLAEREIDQLALDLLAMQQPMAVDLRFVLAVIKSNADLERVGDQAVNIAQSVMDLIALPKADLAVDIPNMGAMAAQMIRQALEAFVSGNAELAQQVLQMDDNVDRLNQEVFVAMAEAMRQFPDYSRQALDTIIIARNLERIADHATNIAEDVIFWVRGTDVRHYLDATRASQATEQPRTG